MLPRIMIYDACSLYKEMEENSSGSIAPIKTIVMNYTEKKWQGAKSTHELWELTVGEKKIYPNYAIPVVDLIDINKYNIPKGEVKYSHEIVQGIFKKEKAAEKTELEI